jgi:archaellum biogenesis protein FlaJ (TadC family)
MDWILTNITTLGLALGLILAGVALPAAIAVIVVLRLPADYFTHTRRDPIYRHGTHPLLGWSLVVLKNLSGLVLVILGIVMIFTPGQGLLTLLVGLMLLNFPGKYRLERRLVRMGPVIPTLNWLRGRWGRAPLITPEA